MILTVFGKYLDSLISLANTKLEMLDSPRIIHSGLHIIQYSFAFLISIILEVQNEWIYLTLPLGFYYLLKTNKKKRESHLFIALLLAYLTLIALMRYAGMHASWFSFSGVSSFWVTASILLFAIGIKLIPKLISSSTSAELKRINKRLTEEIQERKKAEQSLNEHKENLEILVQQRTFDLENTARRLQKEINEHKEAQAQISLQTSLLEQVDSAIIATDLQYNITYWNQCAESLFGWKSSEVLGKPAADVMIRSEHRKAGKRFLEKLSKRKSWSGDFTIPHISGRKIPVELSCSALLDTQGKQIGFTCVAMDITDHLRSERKLQREKEKAIKQAHAKQDFLATMSHEIRTPLNVIIGMTRLLNDANPSQKQLEYLNSLEFSANHLLTIINDILDLAKIDAGKIKLENIGFNLHQVIEGVKQSFSARAEEKGIDLRIDSENNIPAYLKGDQVRLTQILNNLVSNALKFTNEGFITIRTRVLDSRQGRVRLLLR